MSDTPRTALPALASGASDIEQDTPQPGEAASRARPGRRFESLADLSAAGYITDEWSRWQQGECDTYALALLAAHPHLRLGVLGQSHTDDPADGWRETHFFAHDDTHAYDSAGRHPLPYHGIEGNCDVVELDSQPDWYGLEDETTPEGLADATSHARRHHIGPDGPDTSAVAREPVPVADAAGTRHPLTPGVLDEKADWVYRNGQCLALAVAISERTGWPVHLRTFTDGDPADPASTYTNLRHAYAVTPEGTLLDIRGEHDPDIVEEECRDLDGDCYAAARVVPAEGARTLLTEFAGHLFDQDLPTAHTFVGPALEQVGYDDNDLSPRTSLTSSSAAHPPPNNGA